MASGETIEHDPANRISQFYVNANSITEFYYAEPELIPEWTTGPITNRYVPGPGTDEPIVWYQRSGTSSRNFLLNKAMHVWNAIFLTALILAVFRTFINRGDIRHPLDIGLVPVALLVFVILSCINWFYVFRIGLTAHESLAAGGIIEALLAVGLSIYAATALRRGQTHK